jgi:hypothetical protein
MGMTVRIVRPQIQHRSQGIRDWEHALVAVLGFVRQQADPPVLQVHVAPLQRKQFT